MKSRFELFTYAILLGTLCVPSFAQNGGGTASVDRMTSDLEALASNSVQARAKTLAMEQGGKRSRFAKVGNTLLQVAREGVAKGVLQGMVSPASGVTPFTALAMRQSAAARQSLLPIAAPPMQGQGTGGALALSGSAQQSARRVLSVLPPYAQRFWWNSVRALRPDQAEAYFAYQNSKPLAYLQAEARMVGSLLQSLPPQSQQTFMNGVVGVSQDEERFAAQVMSLQIRQNADASAVFAQGQADLHRNGEIYGCILGPDCSVLRITPIR